MRYIVRDEAMWRKLDRVLRDSGELYTLDDIVEAIEEGRMQSFVCGETWIITQVLDFPQKRVLEITFVIGFMGDALDAERVVTEFAKSVGATRVTGFGREGWFKHATPGWSKAGVMYAKDI